MKKFLFSAVALVAFSFAGMANNEGKEVEKKPVEKETKIEKALKADCELVRFVMEVWALGAGYDVETASGYSYVAYFKCLRDNLNN